MSLQLSKNQLEQFEFPISNKGVSKDQRIVNGVKKNATQAIILSTGTRVNDNIPFVDIRLWVMNSDTEKWVPTPKGLRLTPVQYQAFFYMLKNHEDAFLIGKNNNGSSSSILEYLSKESSGELAYEND